MTVCYRFFVSSDSNDHPQLIKGDVRPNSIRRVSGKPGTDGGLIELALVGHPHRYRVRIERGSGTPRLAELHIVPDDSAATVDIDPAAIRQVPVRRLTNAAARWISLGDGKLADPAEIDDRTEALRPDRPSDGGKRRKLDDVHYRQVAELLLTARESGFAPREYVADRLGPASVPTVDRWIAEAKRRKFLPRDWATATTEENDR
ncbi:hypothetical protein A5664_17125 [Mycolicibacterium fortuitum]|nr:hypothetical protein A5664_17125 [Mycolicibacterium fortuitum]